MTTAEYLAERRRIIDRVLEENLPAAKTQPTSIHEAMRYAVLGGGKRIRPILAIARSVSTHVTTSVNTARASLCGNPLARASWMAHSAVSASIRTVTSASLISSGCSGTR